MLLPLLTRALWGGFGEDVTRLAPPLGRLHLLLPGAALEPQTSQEPPPLPALSTGSGITSPSDDCSETISSFLYFAQHPRKTSLCIQ